MAVVCLIVSEIIMNSHKKNYPEGARIKKPFSVVLLTAAAGVLAIPLLILVIKKLVDLVTGDLETFISTIRLLGQGFGFSF